MHFWYWALSLTKTVLENRKKKYCFEIDMSGYDKSGWHFTRNWQKQLAKCKNILSKSVVLCDISYIWIDNMCLGWLIIENCVIITKNKLFLCAFWRTGLVVLLFCGGNANTASNMSISGITCLNMFWFGFNFSFCFFSFYNQCRIQNTQLHNW